MRIKKVKAFKNIIPLFLMGILLIVGITACNVEETPTLPEKPQDGIEDNKEDEPIEAKNTIDEKLKDKIKIVDETSIPESVKEWFKEFNQKEGAYAFQHPHYTYIKINAEEKPTGGYGIHIKEYVEDYYERAIVYEIIEPNKDAMVTQAFTHPSVILEIDSDAVGLYEVKDEDGKVLEYEEKLIWAKLELPKENDTISSIVRVKGKIIAFEAAFSVRILDNNDKVIHEEHLQADAGGPYWGNFDTEISYIVPDIKEGSIELGEYSAKDGEYLLREKIAIKFKK